jgi:REP element-mobilizing transposase RayT
MARRLRLESESGVYHVINRGNYRGDIFRSGKARAAFLKCLDEACRKTGWRVHAWCVMSNHYHLAIETPRGNLVEGMQWLQSTFSMRYNRLRKENGHLFQGRYKSLMVDPDEGLGPLCHYIHLNPVRAKVCSLEELTHWPWSSVSWLMNPKKRLPWFQADAPLVHAGALADSTAGRKKYREYLAWLSEDEPARKALHFERMSKGWAIGSRDFKKALVEEHREASAVLKQIGAEARELRHAVWEDELTRLLRQVGKQRSDVVREGKSAPWKLAVAAALRARSTATNQWLAETLQMGNVHEVSRKVSAWARSPDKQLARRVKFTPNPTA